MGRRVYREVDYEGYRVEGVLGKGARSVVYRVSKEEKMYAMKVMCS